MRRTDRAQAYYRKKSNVRQLQNVLLSYAMYNFDLGYVQASLPRQFSVTTHFEPLLLKGVSVTSIIYMSRLCFLAIITRADNVKLIARST